jgi:hypothetical protein
MSKSTLTEIFWSNFITICSGLVLATLGVIYKSKCRRVKCCGCEIERDIDAEQEIDEHNQDITEGRNPV